jgi:hypothetical protein
MFFDVRAAKTLKPGEHLAVEGRGPAPGRLSVQANPDLPLQVAATVLRCLASESNLRQVRWPWSDGQQWVGPRR